MLSIAWPHWKSSAVLPVKKFNKIFDYQFFSAIEESVSITLPGNYCIRPLQLRLLIASLDDVAILTVIDDREWTKFFENTAKPNTQTLANALSLETGLLTLWRKIASTIVENNLGNLSFNDRLQLNRHAGMKKFLQRKMAHLYQRALQF